MRNHEKTLVSVICSNWDYPFIGINELQTTGASSRMFMLCKDLQRVKGKTAWYVMSFVFCLFMLSDVRGGACAYRLLTVGLAPTAQCVCYFKVSKMCAGEVFKAFIASILPVFCCCASFRSVRLLVDRLYCSASWRDVVCSPTLVQLMHVRTWWCRHTHSSPDSE